MTTQEKMRLIELEDNGVTIFYKSNDSTWIPKTKDTWVFDTFKYRVEPREYWIDLLNHVAYQCGPNNEVGPLPPVTGFPPLLKVVEV